MSTAKVVVKELAGWGFDEDKYRSPMYRGNPDRARALVAGREPFAADTALLEPVDCLLEKLLGKQKGRADLQEEMQGLDWFLGVVDLRRLLAFQRRILLDRETVAAPAPAADDWAALTNLAFGDREPVECDSVRSVSSIELRSQNPNLHLRFTEDRRHPVTLHPGSPFFEVAEYRDRWFLRDGYHRAYRCLRAGIIHLPAVIVRARTIEELGAVHPWFFPEDVLFSLSPPRVIDFLDDALVIQYSRSPLIKTLRITVEETYSLAGDEI